MDLEEGVLGVLLFVRHVLTVAGGAMVVVGDELWRRREDGIWVEGPQGSMEGGRESVFVLGRRRRARAREYIRHGGGTEGTKRDEREWKSDGREGDGGEWRSRAGRQEARLGAATTGSEVSVAVKQGARPDPARDLWFSGKSRRRVGPNPRRTRPRTSRCEPRAPVCPPSQINCAPDNRNRPSSDVIAPGPLLPAPSAPALAPISRVGRRFVDRAAARLSRLRRLCSPLRRDRYVRLHWAPPGLSSAQTLPTIGHR